MLVCLVGGEVIAVIRSREVAAWQGFLKHNHEWECSMGQGEQPL